MNTVPSQLSQITFPIKNRFSIRLNCPQRRPKQPEGIPKVHPLETIFGHFGNTNGNVKIMVPSDETMIFFRTGRGLERPLVQHSAHSDVQRAPWNDFFLQISLPIRIPKGVPGEDPRRTHEPTFSSLFRLCSLGDPLGRPGSPNDTQGHQNDTNMLPKRHQNCVAMPRTTKTEKQNDKKIKKTSMNQSLCVGTVAGRPKAIGYMAIHLYIVCMLISGGFELLGRWQFHLQAYIFILRVC